MCHYITAVLPADADEQAVAAIMERHSRLLAPQENPGVKEQLRPGERYFLTTAGYCDCGTGLGAMWREETRMAKRQSSAEREEERLRKQGWSETKIARWKADKLKFVTKQSSAAVGDWETLLREVLSSGAARQISLLLHWYSGPVSSNIKLLGRERVDIAGLSTDVLARMQEDKLYEFSAG